MHVVKESETTKGLLKQLIEKTEENTAEIKELKNLKKQANIQQKKFEGKWSRFKTIAAIFAIGTPLFSLITGIIDPTVDFPILVERFNAVMSQTYRFFGS